MVLLSVVIVSQQLERGQLARHELPVKVGNKEGNTQRSKAALLVCVKSGSCTEKGSESLGQDVSLLSLDFLTYVHVLG